MTELQRFVALYKTSLDRLFIYLQSIEKDDQYTAVPVSSEANFLGKRLHVINIENLLRHILSAEKQWLSILPQLKAGQMVPFPPSVISTGEFTREEAGNFYRSEVVPQLQAITEIPADDLATVVEFNHYRYTKIGFLWTLLTHQSYHLGQMDLLMRQQGIVAPEFMESYGAQGQLG